MTQSRVTFTVVFMAFAMMLFAVPALAQTESTSTEDSDSVLTETVIETDDGDTVVIDDAGAQEVTQPLSNFGLWWRGVKERVSLTFTFDPVAKAEKTLQYAEERQKIFENMMENATTDQEKERAQVQLDKSQALMDKIAEKKEEWLNSDKADRIAQLQENIAASQVRRENIFDRLEEVVPEERLAAIQELRLKAQEHSQALLERVATAGENIPEEIQARIEVMKTFIDEKKAELEDFQARREALQEELQNLTPEERQIKMEELNQERRELNQERVEKTKELLDQRKEKIDELKTQAAEGDEDAAAELQRVQQVNQQIRENVQERKVTIEENREMIQEQVQERRDEIMEQSEASRPRVTQEEVQQVRDNIRESMIDGSGAGFEPIPGPADVSPLPPRDPAFAPTTDDAVEDTPDVEEDKGENTTDDSSDGDVADDNTVANQ